MPHNENSRVKIPALVHFTRLGYKYISLRKYEGVIDDDTNILVDVLSDAINRINATSLTTTDTQKIVNALKAMLENDDLGREFYSVLINGYNGLKLIDFEDITMDLTERKVRRGDNYLHLSPTEFRLLKMLLKEPGKVFSREVLLKSVWGENIYVETRTVDVHIRRLRKTLNKYGPDYIRTVRSNCYSIDKNISSQDDETILHNDMENKQ